MSDFFMKFGNTSAKLLKFLKQTTLGEFFSLHLYRTLAYVKRDGNKMTLRSNAFYCKDARSSARNLQSLTLSTFVGINPKIRLS